MLWLVEGFRVDSGNTFKLEFKSKLPIPPELHL